MQRHLADLADDGFNCVVMAKAKRQTADGGRCPHRDALFGNGILRFSTHDRKGYPLDRGRRRRDLRHDRPDELCRIRCRTEFGRLFSQGCALGQVFKFFGTQAFDIRCFDAQFAGFLIEFALFFLGDNAVFRLLANETFIFFGAGADFFVETGCKDTRRQCDHAEADRGNHHCEHLADGCHRIDIAIANTGERDDRPIH